MLWHGKHNRLIANEQYEVSAVRTKMGKMYISAMPGSVCRPRFHCVTMDVLGVKSLAEHGFEG